MTTTIMDADHDETVMMVIVTSVPVTLSHKFHTLTFTTTNTYARTEKRKREGDQQS